MRHAELVRGLRWAWLVLVLLCAAPAWAQNCTASVTDVDFGAPTQPLESHVDTTATVEIRCVTITALITEIEVCPGLDYGSGGGTDGMRTLIGPDGRSLSYALYQDAARQVPWGSRQSPQLGTVPLALLRPGLSLVDTVTLTLYARLFTPSDARPGVYTSIFEGTEATFYYARVLQVRPIPCSEFSSSNVIHPEFAVRVNLAPGCTVTATDLAFPSTGLLSTALVAQTNLSVTCAQSTAYTVGLDYGLNGSSPMRRMVSGSGTGVQYELFRDAARIEPWGLQEEGLALAGTGTGTAQSLVVYGRVPTQETPAPGQYADRVIVTVTY